MKYKDGLNRVFEIDAGLEHFLPGYPVGYAPITDQEAAALLVPPAPTPEEQAEGKRIAIEEVRRLRAEFFACLNGLQIDAGYNNETEVIAAIMVAKQSLKDATAHHAVTAAAGYADTKRAVLAQYHQIAAQLSTSAPSASSAFAGLAGRH